MKSIQILLVSIITILLPFAALAEDNISVSVNGHSYTCSGDGENFKYACLCEPEHGDVWLNYYRVERNTGVVKKLRWVAAFKDGSNQEKLDACNQAKLTNIVCQGL